MKTTRQLRKELTALGLQIRELRRELREYQRAKKSIARVDLDLWKARKEFRHRHIGYSLARGRTREQIERPAESNKPREELIDRYRSEYEEARQKEKETHAAETVCAGA